jgi:hypothetical protein
MTGEEMLLTALWFVLDLLTHRYLWWAVGLLVLLVVARAVIEDAVSAGVKRALSGLEYTVGQAVKKAVRTSVKKAVREAVEEARVWREEEWDGEA